MGEAHSAGGDGKLHREGRVRLPQFAVPSTTGRPSTSVGQNDVPPPRAVTTHPERTVTFSVGTPLCLSWTSLRHAPGEPENVGSRFLTLLAKGFEPSASSLRRGASGGLTQWGWGGSYTTTSRSTGRGHYGYFREIGTPRKKLAGVL